MAKQKKPPPGKGDWLSGMAIGPAGVRGYHLFRPKGHGLPFGEKAPLMVMLHGCCQTGRDFAAVTRMNQLAARERFLVLYPEQDRIAHPNGCWNWYGVSAWSGGAAKRAFSDPAGPDATRMAWAFAVKQFDATTSPA